MVAGHHDQIKAPREMEERSFFRRELSFALSSNSQKNNQRRKNPLIKRGTWRFVCFLFFFWTKRKIGQRIIQQIWFEQWNSTTTLEVGRARFNWAPHEPEPKICSRALHTNKSLSLLITFFGWGRFSGQLDDLKAFDLAQAWTQLSSEPNCSLDPSSLSQDLFHPESMLFYCIQTLREAKQDFPSIFQQKQMCSLLKQSNQKARD